jgi:hypothetical protein
VSVACSPLRYLRLKQDALPGGRVDELRGLPPIALEASADTIFHGIRSARSKRDNVIVSAAPCFVEWSFTPMAIFGFGDQDVPICNSERIARNLYLHTPAVQMI